MQTALTDNVLSNIMLNLDNEAIKSLSQTNNELRARTIELYSDNYYWKLAVEGIVGQELSIEEGISYKHCYKYIKAIGNNLHLMFAKGLPYASICMLMLTDTSTSVALVNTIREAVPVCDIETLRYILNHPSIPSDVWNMPLLDRVMSLLRQDLALALIEDGRCLQPGNSSIALLRAAECGLSKVFSYILHNYSDVELDILDASFEQVCCTGSVDIADYLISIGYGNVNTQEYVAMVHIANNAHYEVHDLNILCLYTLVEYGYVENVVDSLFIATNELEKAIYAGIRNGRIHSVGQMLPLITRHCVLNLYKCAEICIRSIGSDSLALELFRMLPNCAKKTALMSEAYHQGNFDLLQMMRK